MTEAFDYISGLAVKKHNVLHCDCDKRSLGVRLPWFWWHVHATNPTTEATVTCTTNILQFTFRQDFGESTSICLTFYRVLLTILMSLALDERSFSNLNRKLSEIPDKWRKTVKSILSIKKLHILWTFIIL